jgi:hypothetical protein
MDRISGLRGRSGTSSLYLAFFCFVERSSGRAVEGGLGVGIPVLGPLVCAIRVLPITNAAPGTNRSEVTHHIFKPTHQILEVSHPSAIYQAPESYLYYSFRSVTRPPNWPTVSQYLEALALPITDLEGRIDLVDQSGLKGQSASRSNR